MQNKNLVFLGLLLSFCLMVLSKEEKFSENTPVTIFTTKLFNEHKIGFKNLSQPYFVMFYAPWCPHCKRLIPTWERLAEHFKDKLTIGSVDCTEHSELQERFMIRGYPTLLLFTPGNLMYKYKGERSFEKMLEFLEGGYQQTDSEEIPQKANIFKDIKAQLSQPGVLIAFGVLAVFTIILAAVCIMDVKENRKLERLREEVEKKQKEQQSQQEQQLKDQSTQSQEAGEQKEKLD